MDERNMKRTQNNCIADNLPVIAPKQENVNNALLAPCHSCDVIDVVPGQRFYHICPQCKETNILYTRKANNNFQSNKTTRNDFLTDREMVEKLGCLSKERILLKQKVKSLLNKVKNCEKLCSIDSNSTIH